MDTPPPSPVEEGSRTSGLSRGLGATDVALLVVGVIIGAGIFTTPGLAALHLHSSGWILAAWAIGGVLALCGALFLAELGSAFPRAGGDYVYLRECFGPLPAFLYGWLFFTVSGTGSIAALGVAAGEIGHSLAPALPGVFVAIGLVVALTALNWFGLRAGTWTQNVLTVIKIGALAAVIVLGFLSPGVTPEIVAPVGEGAGTGSVGGIPILGLGIALVPISFTYMGWNVAGYVGGEVRSPTKNLPRGLLLGTGLVVGLYLLVNAAYLHVMTPAQLRGEEAMVAARACQGLLGGRATGLVSALVLVSIIGGINGMVLSHARVLYAMSREGHFLGVFGHVHPRWRTPDAALLIQAAWTIVLVATGTFARLVGYVTFVMVAMSALVVIGLFVLRSRRATAPPTFRSPGYPVLPVLYLIASVWILVAVVRFAPLDAAIGAGLAVVGAAIYPLWRWARNR
jgi:basic amino acid/polyamine antiporter, APA family